MREVQPLAFRNLLLQACAQIEEIKSAIEKEQGQNKEKECLVKQLDRIYKGCESLEKKYAAKLEVSSSAYERLHKLLVDLGTIPAQNSIWQNQFGTNAFRALFWQIMYQLQAHLQKRLAPIKKQSTVTSKRYRLEKVSKVSNDCLDKK